MRVLLVNDTRVDINFGCHGTLSCLESMLEKGGLKVGYRLPLEAFYQDFSKRNVYGRFPSFLRPPKYDWENSVTELVHSLHQLPTLVDVAVVNGEGTLHHDRLSTRALIGIMEALHRLSVPIVLTNCTIQDIPVWLHPTLSKCLHVSVREPLSLRYCLENNIHAVQGADFLFNMRLPVRSEATPVLDDYILYTPGVTVTESILDKVRDIRELSDQGPIIVACVTYEDLVLFHHLRNDRRITVIPPSQTDHLIDVIVQARRIVTGRYHMAILSALLGRPTTVLPSNSWKMDGLVELLGMKDGCPVSEERIQCAKQLTANNLRFGSC